MKRAGPDFCWLGLGVLVVLLVLAASAPVMRERDQAALLDGSVRIARSGDFGVGAWYNYDKQFLSYWALAGVFELAGLDEPGADPDEVVSLGNRSAAVFFSLSLLIALGCSPRRSLAFLPVVIAGYLAPALLFSVPLLSSNIFSAGCLLLLAAAMRRRHAGWCNALLCALLAAAAVGFRRDAGLVLPLLCLLGTTRFSIGGLFQERRHWLMVVAAVGMVVLGTVLFDAAPYAPEMLFDARLFAAYVVFGLAGAAGLFFWLPFRLVTSRRRWPMRAATAGAMVLPFAFYAAYLYTPRHLLLPALVLVLVPILPRGELWWRALRRRPLDRFVIWSSVLVSLALWGVGFRFERVDKPAVVVHEATLYPTADGFWPMGCYHNFFVALSRANVEPVDHNQEVWDAWKNLSSDQLPAGTARVYSLGLRAYGELTLTLMGRAYVGGDEGGDLLLVPDRSLGRSRPGFEASPRERRALAWDDSWFRLVGGTEWRQIYIVDERGERQPRLELPWVAQLAIVRARGADDFHLRPGELPGDWFSASSRGLRLTLVFAAEKDAMAFLSAIKAAGWQAERSAVEAAGLAVQVVSLVSEGQLPPAAEGPAENAEWVARSLLPAFMSRQNF